MNFGAEQKQSLKRKIEDSNKSRKRQCKISENYEEENLECTLDHSIMDILENFEQRKIGKIDTKKNIMMIFQLYYEKIYMHHLKEQEERFIRHLRELRLPLQSYTSQYIN